MKVCQTGVSPVPPCRQVLIQRLHPWEWYGSPECATLCHPVPPCVSTSFSSTPVSRVARVAQGGTGWHRVAHPRIRTTPKGEAAESVPVCGVAQVAHRFDKLFNLHMYIVTHVIVC